MTSDAISGNGARRDSIDQRQHVIQACYDHDVKFIRLWFTDILGILKSVAITIEELRARPR